MAASVRLAVRNPLDRRRRQNRSKGHTAENFHGTHVCLVSWSGVLSALRSRACPRFRYDCLVRCTDQPNGPPLTRPKTNDRTVNLLTAPGKRQPPFSGRESSAVRVLTGGSHGVPGARRRDGEGRDLQSASRPRVGGWRSGRSFFWCSSVPRDGLAERIAADRPKAGEAAAVGD